jgi:shikimate kinase
MLARRLARRFVDADAEMEARCGVRIPLIFEIEGEAGFRLRERAIIEELTALDGIVLATGGGAIMAVENRCALSQRGVVVYLCAQPADLFRRLRNDRNRPLLMTDDPLKRLEDLYTQRDPLYREVADIIVETGRQKVQLLARQLLALLEEPCKRSA